MKAAARMIVKGTVQGVFFRKFVKEHADDLKLRGHVRNLDNGDVEIVVEGDQEQIDRLKGFVQKGPEHSHIRSVEVEPRRWSGDFDEFKVLRI